MQANDLEAQKIVSHKIDTSYNREIRILWKHKIIIYPHWHFNFEIRY